MGLLSTTNHYHHSTETEYVPYEKKITVTEHRAPTDDSLRLLNQMEEKARQNIIQTIKIEGNDLKALAIYYKDAVFENRITYHLQFELNGKKYFVEGYIDNYEWKEEMIKLYHGLGYKQVYEALCNRFAQAIASELMNVRDPHSLINDYSVNKIFEIKK